MRGETRKVIVKQKHGPPRPGRSGLKPAAPRRAAANKTSIPPGVALARAGLLNSVVSLTAPPRPPTAVFTEVSPPPRRPAGPFATGVPARAGCGIGAGIENTNYFSTDGGHFVPTPVRAPDARATALLPAPGAAPVTAWHPVPAPKADAAGEILFEVCGKPAALSDRLHGGQHPGAPTSSIASRWRHAGARTHRPARLPLAPTEFGGACRGGARLRPLLPHLSIGRARADRPELAYQEHSGRIGPSTPSWWRTPSAPSMPTCSGQS